MKTRILIFCGIVLAVCLCLLLWRASVQPKAKSPEVQAPLTNQPMVSQPSPPPTEVAAAENSTSAPSPDFAVGAVNRNSSEESNRMQQRVLARWQGRIEFYGKVVDENTNPVAGATVNFSWVEAPTADGNKSATAISDSRGLFELHDQVGLDLGVSVGKAGYYSSRRDSDTFNFGPLRGKSFSSDPANPAIFHLLKKGKGESLIEEKFPPLFTQIWQLHHDGTPIKLDLLNGSQNVTGDGQLKLEFWRDVSVLKAAKFDWKLQFSVQNGGLVPTDEEFAFQAPEIGFQPSIIIDMPATNQNWIETIRSKYYVKLPDGKYGRVDFYLLSHNGVFTVHSVVNPSGSRNLEPP
jgi:hypothetical protein